MPPASDDLIRSESRDLHMELPSELSEFYRQSNGLKSESGVRLYAVNELSEKNESGAIDQFAPEYLAVGEDKRGRTLLMSHSLDLAWSKEARIVTVPFLLPWQKWIERGLDPESGPRLSQYTATFADIWLKQRNRSAPHLSS